MSKRDLSVGGYMRAAMTIATVLVLFGADPTSVLAQIEVPKGAIVPEPRKLEGQDQHLSDAAKKINDILGDGRSSDSPSVPGNDDVKSSGDPILDDVLSIIRQRGSVLRGSELESETPQDDLLNESRVQPVVSHHSVYLIAEQLLKSARQLEMLDGPDDRDIDLIRAMRQRAARLLIDAFSSDAIPTENQ